uniref:Lysosomal alpha-glucosidase n=1 Tax=Cyprinodon variegatus TaxID=28743 RepID=A0A3Q2DNX6_CYPVA
MSILSGITVAVLLLSLSLLACLNRGFLFSIESSLIRSVYYGNNEDTAHKKSGYYHLEVPNSDFHPQSIQRSSSSRDKRCAMALESRFDCGRDRLLSQEECEERGCCYAPLPGLPGPPWCFYPALYPGYNMGPLSPSERGQTAFLNRTSPSYLPKDVSSLSLEVTEETPSCFHLLKDPSSPRYEVPLPAVSPQTEVLGVFCFPSEISMNTTVAPLLFADQYLQLSTTLASSLVSGLGEHFTSLILDLNWTSLTLWNRDMAPHVMVLQPTPALTWVSTGGVLDLYIFLGPDPQNVIRQYLQIIGYPMMPPYWSLGFHLCRWGYVTTNATRMVAERMHSANLPMDVQWNDLDYADKRRVFTFDPVRFGDLPEMVQEIHEKGMKYILILDPGISTARGSKQLLGLPVDKVRLCPCTQVWPGPTAFPDFTNPETNQWWEDCIRGFYSEVSVDGLWIVSTQKIKVYKTNSLFFTSKG